MFNFLKFKKASKPTVVNDAVSINEQIHNDVYSAQELLLAEANAILHQPIGYDQERYDRLKKLHSLGFSSAAEVKEFNEMDNMRCRMERQKFKIEYYQQMYPLHKFISTEAVKSICDKYGLLLTRVRHYIAEIPEKNQKEIVAFKVKRRDTRIPDELYVGGSFPMPWYIHDTYEEYVEKSKEMISGEDLLIVAPEHKLKTDGQIKEGHVLKTDDPIVLQPVDEGYLIVTSWGLEAADELVMNPINN